jgi:hypothetical protein
MFRQVKTASASSRKNLSEEQILTKTCADAVSDGPRDVLSENDDDNIENKGYSDFEPKIARKINCTMSSDSESGSAKQEDSNGKSDIFFADWRGAATWQGQHITPYSKIYFLEEIVG